MKALHCIFLVILLQSCGQIEKEADAFYNQTLCSGFTTTDFATHMYVTSLQSGGVAITCTEVSKGDEVFSDYRRYSKETVDASGGKLDCLDLTYNRNDNTATYRGANVACQDSSRATAK